LAIATTRIITTLDNLGSSITAPLKIKQYDTASRFILFELQDNNGNPYNLTSHNITFSARKPDNTYIYNVAAITNATKGWVQVELTTQFSAIAGTVECELNIYGWDGSQRLSTLIFYVEVEETLQRADAIFSTNEFNILENLMRQMWELWSFWYTIEERIGMYISADGDKTSIFKYMRAIYNHLVNEISVSNITDKVSEVVSETIAKYVSGTVTYATAGTYTWTKPSHVKSVRVIAIGGGGGGASGAGVVRLFTTASATSAYGGNAGGSGIIEEAIIDVSSLSTIAITVGAGGSGGVGNNSGTISDTGYLGSTIAPGSNGGASSFGTYLRAEGGSGGSALSLASGSYTPGGSGGGKGGGTTSSLAAAWPGGSGNSARSYDIRYYYAGGAAGSYIYMDSQTYVGGGGGGGAGYGYIKSATDGAQGSLSYNIAPTHIAIANPGAGGRGYGGGGGGGAAVAAGGTTGINVMSATGGSGGRGAPGAVFIEW